ncbi:Fic/DOC family protein [Falsiroseomonas stagni]|uniref:protein adenylyltransferase n=1 Tax=Falsiroseomonas stagni DSM 19981 TaxID=1123062 RepID=A0A1I4DLC1_9PROT|nr:Fic family protein [Falsiroseomonas stagni]SFK92826.1 cell filamentation protein [Falsiroseomonas stagni DSM 19981]
MRHYCAVHRHLFQDVYAWAGKVRRIRTGKDGAWFCYPEHIPGQLTTTFGKLKATGFLRGLAAGAFACAGASFLAELNAIHAFREGNGRTQTLFFAMLAEAAGHPMDLRRLQPDAMLDAMIRSFSGDEAALRKVIEGLMA